MATVNKKAGKKVEKKKVVPFDSTTALLEFIRDIRLKNKMKTFDRVGGSNNITR